MSGTVFGAFCEIVRRIPAGSVSTYGQVARLAGMPRCARLVGYAMASCQDPSVPCHRVVDRFGGTKAAFDTFAPGTQRALLEEFQDNGETVMFAPGEGFYGTPGKGRDEIRLAYILKQEDLRRAMEVLAHGIEAYNARKQ